MAVNGEADAAFLDARDAAVINGDDAGAVLGYFQEDGLGEVEVLTWRIAPTAVIVGERRVGRTEVGGGDGDGAGEAPAGLAGAFDLVAGAAGEAAVEEDGAQGGRVGAVPLAV